MSISGNGGKDQRADCRRQESFNRIRVQALQVPIEAPALSVGPCQAIPLHPDGLQVRAVQQVLSYQRFTYDPHQERPREESRGFRHDAEVHLRALQLPNEFSEKFGSSHPDHPSQPEALLVQGLRQEVH